MWHMNTNHNYANLKNCLLMNILVQILQFKVMFISISSTSSHYQFLWWFLTSWIYVCLFQPKPSNLNLWRFYLLSNYTLITWNSLSYPKTWLMSMYITQPFLFFCPLVFFLYIWLNFFLFFFLLFRFSTTCFSYNYFTCQALCRWLSH